MEKAKVTAVKIRNAHGDPVYFERFHGLEIVAWAMVTVYVEAKCPKCGDKSYMSSQAEVDNGNSPGTKYTCIKCKETSSEIKWKKIRSELVFIYTHLDHRGKGYAGDIIDAIKQKK